MARRNPVIIRASKKDGNISFEEGNINKDNGAIEYATVIDAGRANWLDQQLQFAVGIKIEDLIQNGAATPYIDKLLRNFDSIEIILRGD